MVAEQAMSFQQGNGNGMSIEDICAAAARSLSRTHHHLFSGCREEDMPWSRMPCRIWPLPLDSLVDVAPGATFPLTATVQYAFWAELMVIGSSQAPFTRVESMFVATQNQQVANGAQLGDVYAEDSVNNLLNLDCATPGVDIVINETNTGAVARRMLTSLFGVVKRKNC